MSAQTPRRSRPAGVTALACFCGFGVLASGLSAISLLAPAGPLEPIWRLNPRAHAGFVRMGGWAPLLLSVVCLACASAAYGFLSGTRWGYRVGFTLLLLNGTSDLVNAALGIEPRAWIGVPIVGLILWYLRSHRVRAYFGLLPDLVSPRAHERGVEAARSRSGVGESRPS